MKDEAAEAETIDMAVARQLSDAVIQAIGDVVLRRELGAHGLDHVEIESKLDQSGEPAIYVRSVLKPHTPLVGGDISSKAHDELNDALVQQGEPRFPYFRLHHPDREEAEIEDWAMSA